MRLRRVLLVPQIIRLARHAPRDVGTRWDRYWADVERTGDDGDVLWDASTSSEADHYLDLLGTHADPALPALDIGCGNGRFTRVLAQRFRPAIGVDVSPHAVARARVESGSLPHLEFRVADMIAEGTGRALRSELGPCNVLVRGVLHVLAPAERRRLAANLGELLDSPAAILLVAETNHPGSLLAYLEDLGARPTGFPRALGRAITAGLPRPSPFGVNELADTFPPELWDHVRTDHDARIATVPAHRGGVPDSVPGLVAVLRRRSGAARST
jgi:SAM-dependent methyltransferase